MKIIKEMTIIMAILFLAHIIKTVAGLSVPASILGMIIMLLFLNSGLLKIENVQIVSSFLLNNLTLLLIPGGVGIMRFYGLVKGQLVSILMAIIFSTIIGLATTGILVQFLNSLIKKV